MKMKVKSGGEGGQYELPPDDNHRAAIVAVVDLGVQMEGFGTEPPKPTRKVLVAYELLDAKKADGFRFVVGDAYRLSLHEKAKFREVCEAARGKLADGDDFDPAALLGMQVRLTIEHESKGDRTYHRIAAITAADKKDRGQKAKTEFGPYAWFAEDGEGFAPHDWLPWTWNRAAGKRLPPEGHHAQAVDEAEPATAGAGKGGARDDEDAF